MTRRDLTGQRFGRLTVVRFDSVDRTRNVRWMCRCDCGIEKVIQKAALVSGSQVSCGCAKRESLISKMTIHGMSGSRTHNAWREMWGRSRGYRKADFAHYRARGINVCEQWRSFDNFYADMGECPDGLTLERVNNDLGYSRDNCRWATMHDQNRNRRANRMVEIEGRTMCVMDWIKELNLGQSKVYNRIWRGMEPKQAVLSCL